MSAHTRVYIETSDLAVRHLSCPALKALIYLSNRADEIGSCYPKHETIHAAMGCEGDDRNVQRILGELESGGWIAYRRRNQNDPITRKKLPNVYMLNPEYLCIAEAFQAEAAQEWSRISGKSLFLIPRDSGVPLTNNINQLQVTNTSESAPLTNNNNQQPPSEAEVPKTRAKAKEKASPAASSSEPHQRAAQSPSPSSAPPPSTKRFPNPQNIDHALPEAAHEGLAVQIRALGIPMPMCRGFVAEYGPASVGQALKQTHAAMRDGTADKPPGFFRKILQGDLLDPGVEALPRDDRYKDGDRYLRGDWVVEH